MSTFFSADHGSLHLSPAPPLNAASLYVILFLSRVIISKTTTSARMVPDQRVLYVPGIFFCSPEDSALELLALGLNVKGLKSHASILCYCRTLYQVPSPVPDATGGPPAEYSPCRQGKETEYVFCTGRSTAPYGTSEAVDTCTSTCTGRDGVQ